MINKKEILQNLKKSFGNIQLPSRIDFFIDDDLLTIKMQKSGVLSNMQEDNSAWEAWILVLMSKQHFKNVTIKYVNLSWESPDPSERTGHYNRFIYRVIKFSSKFTWLKINVVENSKEIEGFTAKFLNSNINLVLNYPRTVAKDLNDGDSESFIERQFLKRPEIVKGIKFSCQDHQLPVGLFMNKVNKTSYVFTGGKSGIDLWGIDGNELYIIELKYDNSKVGILSEILLYLWIMEDLFITKKIKYPDILEKELSKEKRNFKTIYNKTLEADGIKKINGILLADRFHPLVKQDVVDYLNRFLGNALEIKMQEYIINSEIVLP